MSSAVMPSPRMTQLCECGQRGSVQLALMIGGPRPIERRYKRKCSKRQRIRNGTFGLRADPTRAVELVRPSAAAREFVAEGDKGKVGNIRLRSMATACPAILQCCPEPLATG